MNFKTSLTCTLLQFTGIFLLVFGLFCVSESVARADVIEPGGGGSLWCADDKPLKCEFTPTAACGAAGNQATGFKCDTIIVSCKCKNWIPPVGPSVCRCQL